jgi:hypothetical protein
LFYGWFNQIATQYNAFQKVSDARNRRVRGPWMRNGTFYAQILPAARVALHRAQTVSQAITEMQALKKKRRDDGVSEIDRKRGVAKFGVLADACLEKPGMAGALGETAWSGERRGRTRQHASSLDNVGLVQ